MDRAQLFWAAVVLDVVTPSLLEDLGHLLEGLQSQDFGSDWQARLFQAHMVLERDGRYRQAWQQKGILALLPGELLAQAEAAWRCALADTAETQVRGTVDSIITRISIGAGNFSKQLSGVCLTPKIPRSSSIGLGLSRAFRISSQKKT